MLYFVLIKNNINVSDLPRVKLNLGSTLDPDNIKEGDDVYFECSINAKPRVYKIVWKFNVSYNIVFPEFFFILITNRRFLLDEMIIPFFTLLFLGN